MNNKEHISIVVISFFALLILFKIAASEIQPWDEGLFAMRAKSILKFGNVIDQSPKSPGGIYSATYPPLVIWVESAAMKFIGFNAFSVRIFPALCSVFTVFLFYNLLRKFYNINTSLFATLLLSGTTFWNYFSRQGMLDVPLICFIFLCFYSTIMLTLEDKNIKWILIWGISFGLALMTKIVLSFIPVLFLFGLLFTAHYRKKGLMLIWGLILGLAIAMPWHIFMYIRHGLVFLGAFFAPHIYSGVENNVPGSGIFFYINQMIISNPLLVLVFPAIYLILKNKKKIEFSQTENLLFNLSSAWFLIGFAVFSVSSTKLTHYSLYFFIPSIIIIGFFLEHRDHLVRSAIQSWTIFSLVLLSTLWALKSSFRDDFKLLAKFEFTVSSIILLSIIAIIVITGVLIIFSEQIKKLNKIRNLIQFVKMFTPARKINFNKTILMNFLFLILIIVMLRVMYINLYLPNGEISGGLKTAMIIKEVDGKSFVYLFNAHNNSDSLNPQLAWYTHGWISGWIKNRSFKPLAMPDNRIDYKTILKSDKFYDEILVYYIPADLKLAKAVIRQIAETRPIMDYTGRYVIFGKVRFSRKEGKII